MTAAVPSPLLRGLSRGQLIALDAALAVGAALLGFLAAIEGPVPTHPGWHEPPSVSVLFGVLLGVPVALRRIRPVAAASGALVLTVAAAATGVVPDYAGLAPTVVVGLVLYTVGTELDRRRSVPIVVVGLVAVAVVFGWVARQPFEVLLVTWVLGACWAVGRTVRERRAYAARAARQATELALGEERLRIARDLHDIVAHSMSVIAVRATVADHVADANPQQMRESLQVIAATSREALAELRRALAALRTEAVVTPAPGLADLGGLIGAARTAGLAVDLDVRGDEVLPDGLELAVFRLVQEALTNVLKHAHATACRVQIDIGPDEVRVEVSDDGTAAPRASGIAGQGLVGMRERAALFGGELAAEPRAQGGWLVAATLRRAT
ncbi:histidine kinase [Paractinoplanes ferrugineus]|uniref:histidine kinase n=1 Tax=Paractinoplanes ferrugineus TaxID=113564 RepID=A0A919IW48_9ACTN|nr:sensor histidine kinase [Actinoplanes ferrugineus]GIE09284.1 two-component sensor histidine kinase [Actinoplanes ferrugineus]